ncbi:ExeM/NucH family extracellular endonuclease [Actinomadura madurae]|uniref:ExeM/NucH family extracellular endonuclease n=1 Tax=Actinomadura madurae TaxID=1993 RepID=UPI002025D30F|nr:ExeM/NucH family extracellular endonuclease [Actinomadura madurae]URM95201.1 ExeM/NucH family extracellular endonuclease [Actinomadura madurae]URN05910.1 ExeM/NucH family extracellular endonuclease [Actinomadura madurae]
MRRTAAALATVLTAGLTAGAQTAAAAEPSTCGTPADHQIAEVQGGGDASPLNGRTVRVEGVVTADFQRSDQLGGFFVQDPTPDADPRTSDGLFVYSTADVAAGDRVLVTGKAIEYNGLTELSPVSAVDVCGKGRVAPAEVRLPLKGGATLERYEGMLLRFGQRLTATETYQLGRYGEVTVSAGGRLFQPTDGHGSTQARNDARKLLVDDGSNVQNPDTIPYTDPRVLRIGDSARGLTGVLGYGFGEYRLEPTRSAHFAPTDPRPKRPGRVGGDVRVASFNTLNWFTTLNRRGADTAEEQERQLAKLTSALKGLDADVVGLMEVENNGDTAVKALVDRLNASGAGTYAWVRHPFPGTDEIHVALIYRPAAVTPAGAARSSDDPVFDRPPLVQAFRPAKGGTAFTMIVNHFKSKGCDGATGPDQDQGDGQGCYNARRVAQAKAIAAIAAGARNPLVVGDLNAYTAEDPVRTLAGAGLAGQTQRFVRPDQRYSYLFDGQAGELDHALAGKALSRRVTGATIWHVNSDEPVFLDYNTEFNPARFYRPDAFRSSDHDPVLLGLDLR